MACPVIATWSGVGLGGDLEPRLLRRSGEDGPAVGGRPGGVVGLAGGQRAVAGVHGRERGLVLLPGPALELVDDGVAHGLASTSRTTVSRATPSLAAAAAPSSDCR